MNVPRTSSFLGRRGFHSKPSSSSRAMRSSLQENIYMVTWGVYWFWRGVALGLKKIV